MPASTTKHLIALILWFISSELTIPLFTRPAEAEIVGGVSFYAIQGYSKNECARALKVFNGLRKPALAMLWGTFGVSNQCIQQYLEKFSATPHILEIHITNNTCLRGRICRRGEILRGIVPRRYNTLLESKDPGLMAALKGRINSIVITMKRIRGENTQLLISTALEDNYSLAAYEVVRSLLVEAQTVTPFLIVRSPMSGREQNVTNADLFEAHGFSPRIDPRWEGRCLVNNDGDEIVFRGRVRPGQKRPSELLSYLKRYQSQGCWVFLWWSGAQGLLPKLGPRISPMRRTFILRPRDISTINEVLVANQG